MTARLTAIAVPVAFGLAACNRPATAVSTASPAATPEPEVADGAPLLQPSAPAKKLPDGRIEYHVVIAAVTRTVFVPMELASQGGKGDTVWSAPHARHWRYDARSDRFVSADDGAAQAQFDDAVLPGANQVLSLPVTYAGTPPASETLTLTFRSLTLAQFAARAYPAARIEDPATTLRAVDPRGPIGSHLYDLDVARRLAAGFFLRDDTPPRTASVQVPGWRGP